VNSYLAAMYIFQFGFMQPAASLVNSQIPVAIMTLLILIGLFLINGFRVQKYVISFFAISSIYFLLSALFFSADLILTLEMYLEFLLKGFSGFLAAGFAFEEASLFRAFVGMGVLNFLAIGLSPFVSFLSSMNYMRFGYALIPSALMFLFALYGADSIARKLAWVALSALSLGLTLVYGSRGVLIVIFMFFLLVFVFSKRIGKVLKAVVLMGGPLSLYMALKSGVLLRVVDFVSGTLGVQTYSLSKIQMMMSMGLAVASSGRDIIYYQLVQLIRTSPLFGFGIGSAQFYVRYTAHNIVLQILVESGVAGLLLWLVVWARPAWEYVRLSKDREDAGYFEVATLLLAVAFGRLLISSDMWLRPEYWFVLSFLLNPSVRRRRSLSPV
jgi:O-antigen ligase